MAENKQPSGRWHRLDNTANLFPVITSKRLSNVFRLSVNLEQPVSPELLQKALEKTLPRFAAFRVRLRKGMFWHYLEANNNPPFVTQEDEYPCQYINPAQNNDFLFRIGYYANRINLEVFHVLTDGTGALRFLQAICCQYLLLAHPASFSAQNKEKAWFSEHAANTEDSYVANYTPTQKTNFRAGRGYKLRGEHSLLEQLSVIHAHIGLEELLALCHEKGVSLTQYITACIAWAVYTQQLGQRPPKHPVNILLPVNLRNLFESNTALNFFSNIYLSYSYEKENLTFEDVLQQTKQQFGQKLSREGMLEKISYTVGSGYSLLIRMVPLPVKNVVLRAIFESSAKSSTLSFSNLGRVEFPEIFRPFVTGVSFLLSSTPREPFKCSAVSYQDILTLSFTSHLRSTALQRAIVRRFTQDGLWVRVESNGVDYESL